MTVSGSDVSAEILADGGSEGNAVQELEPIPGVLNHVKQDEEQDEE